jgi:hypothetical protein
MRWTGARTVAAAAVIWCALVFAGCGGGGGGGGDDSSGQQQNQNTAPATVAGQRLTLTGNSTREIALEATGGIWTENQNGFVRGGTYQYTPNANTAELILFESGASSTIRLTFSNSDSGVYLAHEDQGTFQFQPLENDPNDPGPSPSDPVTVPSSLDGLTLYGTRTFTSTGPVGQTHVYTFSGNKFHDSDPPEESDGDYIYTPGDGRASLTLLYEAPRTFSGDRHELALAFTTGTSGTFESIYTRRDGTTIRIDGTFLME